MADMPEGGRPELCPCAFGAVTKVWERGRYGDGGAVRAREREGSNGKNRTLSRLHRS